MDVFVSGIGADVETSLVEVFNGASGIRRDTIALLIILCDFYKNEVTWDLVNNKWWNLRTEIQRIPCSSLRIEVQRRDAREIPFEDGAADIALSSPPYINVMNYHQQYRQSVEALGYPVLKIAKSEFSSNRKNKGNRLLTVIEYVVDMGLSLREISRVLKPGHHLMLVVGKESHVLGQPFSNSEIVWRAAVDVLGMTPLLRQQ